MNLRDCCLAGIALLCALGLSACGEDVADSAPPRSVDRLAVPEPATATASPVATPPKAVEGGNTISLQAEATQPMARAANSTATPTTTGSATLALANVHDLRIAPISTYQRVCATCHGPQGSYHWDRIMTMDRFSLQGKIHEMMHNQGQMRPSPSEQAAMLAYHRSMLRPSRSGPLFMVVTNAESFLKGSDGVLRGEISEGGSVKILLGEMELPAVVKGTGWTIENAPTPPFALRGELAEQNVTIAFPRVQWSNAQ